MRRITIMIINVLINIIGNICNI